MIKKSIKYILFLILSSVLYGQTIDLYSMMAAKDLVEKYVKYQQYGTLRYERKDMTSTYYIVTDYEPPGKIKIISKAYTETLDPKKDFYGIFYHKNGYLEEEITDSGLVIYYDQFYHKIKFNSDDRPFHCDFIHQISCSSYATAYSGTCHIYYYRQGDDETSRLYLPGVVEEKAKIFSVYFQKYKGQSVFRDENTSIIQIINYKNKNLEYDFIINDQKYKVTCDVIFKECKV